MPTIRFSTGKELPVAGTNPRDTQQWVTHAYLAGNITRQELDEYDAAQRSGTIGNLLYRDGGNGGGSPTPGMTFDPRDAERVMPGPTGYSPEDLGEGSPVGTAGSWAQFLASRGILGQPVTPSQRYISQFASPIRNIYNTDQLLRLAGVARPEPQSWWDFAQGFGRGVPSETGEEQAGPGLLSSTREAALRSLQDIIGLTPQKRTEAGFGWGRTFDPVTGEAISEPSLKNLQGLVRSGLAGQFGGIGSSYLASNLPTLRRTFEGELARGVSQGNTFLDWLSDRYNFQPRAVAQTLGQ